LAAQCKRGESIASMASPLNSYAQRVYADRGDAILARASEDLDEIEALRREIVAANGKAAGGDAMAARVRRYYGMLSAIEARFPVSKDKAHVSDLAFTWWDAFRTSKKEKQTNLNFEKAAILFNLGAIHSQQAIESDRTTENGLKAACREFQQASGYFRYCRDNVALLTDGPPHPLDVSPDALKALELVMLAQAQECVLEKAMGGAAPGEPPSKASEGALARVAKQVQSFYAEANAEIATGQLSQHLEKAWILHLKCKELLFSCETELLAAEAERKKDEADSIGSRIARLRHADMQMKECVKMAKQLTSSGSNSFFQDAAGKLSTAVDKVLRKAVKENETVYLSRVPKYDSLAPIAEAKMVKVVLPTKEELTGSSGDVFVGLVPDSSAKVASKYTEMVDVLIKKEKDSLCSATDDARVKLKQMELPDILLALEHNADMDNAAMLKAVLPDGLYSKVSDFNRSGGTQHCQEFAKDLQSMRGVGIDMLNTAERDLDAESKEDEAMREQWKDKWVVPMSASLTMLLRDNIAEFKSKLSAAEQSDLSVTNLLSSTGSPGGSDDMSLLGFDKMSKLAPMLRKPIMSVGPDPNEVVNGLKRTLMELENCAGERTNLEEKLNEMKFKDNVLPKLMSSKEMSEEKLFKEELQKYQPLQNSVSESIASQDQLLKKLAELHAQFASVFSVAEWKGECDAFASRVKTIYESYSQVQHDLEEGLRFYTSLQDAIGSLRQQCSDFCVTRRMQREELARRLQYPTQYPPPPPPQQQLQQQYPPPPPPQQQYPPPSPQYPSYPDYASQPPPPAPGGVGQHPTNQPLHTHLNNLQLQQQGGGIPSPNAAYNYNPPPPPPPDSGDGGAQGGAYDSNTYNPLHR